MTTHTDQTTETIAASLRRNPVVDLMVPSYAFRSVPVPAVLSGVPCLVFYFYPAKGESGKPKATYPPLTKVVVAKTSGKVIEVVSAPLFWPRELTPDKPLGTYPGKELIALSRGEVDSLYAEYYELCDKLLREAESVELSRCPSFTEWMALFRRVSEEGFDMFFPETAPASSPSMPPAPPAEQPKRKLPIESEATTRAGVTTHRRDEIQSCTDVTQHMQATRQFLTAAGFQELIPLWRDIAMRREQTSFTVAAVGEFSRGKSTLLNRLLDEDVLPVGDLPTTAILTRIRHGASRVGCRVLPDKTRQEVDVSVEAISQFGVDAAGNDPEGVLQIDLPNAWLDANNLVLFDTPGAADLAGRRAALAVEAIARCDGAIVVVNATMPCSMTEMEFVHDHIIYKCTPRVAAAITKLDLIPSGERQALIAHIASKMHETSPSIEIWTVQSRDDIPEIDGAAITAAGASSIRDRLSAWSSDPSIAALRDIQAAAQLHSLLKSAVSLLDQQASSARLSKQEQENAIKLQEMSIERAAMDWEDLRIALDQRSSETERWVHASLSKVLPEVVEDMRQSLGRTSNPKAWWEQEFPYQLRRHVKLMSASLVQQLDQRVAADHAWLDSEVRTQFHLQCIAPRQEKPMSGLTLPNPVPGKPLSDLDRRKTRSRIALLGGTVVSYGLLSPLGFMPVAIGITGALSLWSETTFKRLVDAQKATSSVEVATSIDQVFQSMEHALLDRVASWYRGMFNAIRQEASCWQQAQLASLERGTRASLPELQSVESLTEKARTQLTLLAQLLEEAK